MRKLEGGRSHDPNIRKKRWPLTNPRTKHSTGATKPRSRNQSTKLRGKEDGNQEHPHQSFTDFIATKENKEGVASEESIV
jgi:hypothetical protein